MNDWQPIETAPKDRTWVLCAWKNSAGRFGIPVSLYWHGECWTDIDPALTPVTQNALRPTHWMPLPASPDESTPQRMVLRATDEHPAVYRTATSKLVAGGKKAIEAINAHEESQRLMRVADAQADFQRRYSSLIADDRRRDDFERELVYLIHLVYREAQEPLIKQLTGFVVSQSRPLIIEKTLGERVRTD